VTNSNVCCRLTLSVPYRAAHTLNVGITSGAVKLLAKVYEGRKPSGSVVTFGVQAIEASPVAVKALLEGTLSAAAGRERRRSAFIPQEQFFRLLGFESVESIDVYPTELPTHVLDLNLPVPETLRGRFDLVYDGGTSEHCVCVPEVLANAVRLAKTGGRVIHHAPLNNWIDHGFYQFSPTLFFDFYEANGFDELRMMFHFIDRHGERFLPYEPEHFGRLPYSFGGKTKVMGFFSACKKVASNKIVYPMQSRYRRASGGESDHRSPTLSGWPRLMRSIGKRTFRLRARRL